MKVLYPLGTSYLCSQFVNHDGTLCSDHPLYLFKTNKKDIVVAVMFTSKSNPYTVSNSKGFPVTFRGCSTHYGEREGRKVFQAEVYICNLNRISLSEYSFKHNEIYSRDLFNCLEKSLKQYFINPNYGIKSVHWYDKSEDVFYKEDILKDLLRVVRKIKYNPNYSFPKKGIVNCDYASYRKLNNSNLNITHNKKIFDERWGSNV